MKKDFDCVEMKRKGQDALRERLKGLTPEQELAFWEEESRRLREDQRRAQAQQKKSA